MKQAKSIKELRALRRRWHCKSIGFVPTMGALHEGHLSLIRAARRENDAVMASIFVNPMQFGPQEDFKKYPRDLKRDFAMLKREGTDLVFVPSVSEIYPDGFGTKVIVGGPDDPLTHSLCGKFRPGHFDGVSTVVAKLFHLVRPAKAYFGQKDYQQAAVIRKMVKDLNLPLEIKVLATVREKDGLAMSSRNVYLTPADRIRSRAIPQTLFWIRKEILAGRRNLRDLLSRAKRDLGKKVDRVQYLEVVDPETLLPLSRFQSRMVALTACLVGKTRLIDNVIIRS